MKKSFFAAALFLALISSGAHAAEGDLVACPVRTVGETFSYEVEETSEPKGITNRTVTAVQGDVIQVTNQRGRVGTYDTVFNTIKNFNGTVIDPKYHSFPDCPFKLGEVKKYAGQFTTRSGNFLKGEFTVTMAKEFTTTQTQAGTFQALEVVSVFNYSWVKEGFSGNGVTREVSYYSPEIGSYVKLQSVDSPSRGPIFQRSMELTNYKK